MYQRLTPEEVADRLEIYDLFARYVHAADGQDIAAMDEVFLEETVFDWTASGGARDLWKDARQGDFITGKTFEFVFHLCGNLKIVFGDDGDSAVVESKTIHPTGLRGRDGEPRLFQVHGGYTDQLRRTDYGWRIVERRWNDAWVVGGLREVKGIPAMLREADALAPTAH